MNVALSPLLQIVFDRLASPVLGSLQELYGLKQNFTKLQKSLPVIQDLLDDAEERQVTSKSIQIWLSKLRDVVYDSDDLLDELASEIALCENCSSICAQVRSLILPFEPSRRLFGIAHDLEKMLNVLDSTIAQGLSFNLKEKAHGLPSKFPTTNRESHSSVQKSKIYGREVDKEKILELLLSDLDAKMVGDVTIIPIVGMGGIGKTTLAQLAYNDVKLIGYFDLKMWVYVSDDFNVKRLVRAIIESASRTKCDLLEMDVLQSQMQESLCGKRFLLVLDDVWIEDSIQWERFGDLLRGGLQGSKVIVTTRSNKVASIAGTTSSYYLGGLPQDDCWKLFKELAFAPGEEKKYPQLLPIGRKILRKCGGVPLVAKTLGSLMHLKREVKEWMDVQQQQLYLIDECPSGILPILRLSYDHLPPHLKRCFAFCSLFPKNYEIRKEKLIHVWMAEGLIQAYSRDRCLEDIGNEYFNNLLWMSFFQEVDGKEGIYKMHDLIHDLAVSIMGNEFVRLEHENARTHLAQARHSSVVCKFGSSAFPQSLLKATRLRTLLLLSLGFDAQELPFLPTSFLYLRVLTLNGCGIKSLQDSISELMSLRYLDLSNTSIQTLPESICELLNLQTLDLSGCCQLVKLPIMMQKLNGLRHLKSLGCEGLTSMPPGIGKLIQLQTWQIYIVGNGVGQSIAELKCLNLQGELHIKCLKNIRDTKEAMAANLKEKCYLKILSLSWEANENIVNEATEETNHHFLITRSIMNLCSSEVSDEFNRRKHTHSAESLHNSDKSNNGSTEVEDIMKCLEPHQNLAKLYIKGYPGTMFPRWKLPNLTMIVLIDCKSCINLPTLGSLLQLKTIYLQGMDNVEFISTEFYSSDACIPFPSVEELTLRDFPNLKSWFDADHRAPFPCLKKLIICKCPNLTTIPHFPSLQHLELQDCHPTLINSVENLSCLSALVVDTFPDLEFLSDELFKNNHSLASLKISSCRSLHSLPSEIGHLSALKSLTISSCESLSIFPEEVHNLKSLESLEIIDCHNISSLSDTIVKGLTSLKTLFIENCTNLVSLSTGLQHLTVLEKLAIVYCPNLESISIGSQNLSLKSLSILCCPKLDSLPECLQHITALQTLEIRSCSGIKDLPEWIIKLTALRSLAISQCENLTALPEGLKQLENLQHLSIQDCPKLESWCKQVKSRWLMLSQIPHVYVGSPNFQK